MSPDRFKTRSSAAMLKTIPHTVDHHKYNTSSLVSDHLRFSESGITVAEQDSLPNTNDFMHVLVGCDSDENSELEMRHL